ncbi:MAG: hypothetical protein JNK49_01850 [Planctomycetes bacterium]|nr:hypothetical protein [Planctomycetota bacterium]
MPRPAPIALLTGAVLCTLAGAQAPNASTPAPRAPTWNEDVAPLVFARCSPCHRPGEVAPFPLLTFQDARKRARKLLEAVEQRYMPPWHPDPGHGQFRNEARLRDSDIALLRAWVQAGTPEGPPERAPKPPEFPVGWQLGEPDLVLRTSGAFEVPAGGRDVYRNFAIPLGLPDDVYVTAIEVRPSARSVLHHVLVFLDEERTGQAQDGRDGQPGFRGMRFQRSPMIAGWAVGGMPEHLPSGLSIKIPKGSDLVLQSHFHPSGKKEREQTTLGLFLAKQPPKRTLVSVQLPPFFGFTAGLDIPPGEKDYRLADSFVLPCDVEAVTIGGHAHMLCTSLRMWAESSNGQETPLLKIGHWDFDWQNRYTFASLVPLAKGQTLRAELRYDNSADNPNNPNRPPRAVRWGRETTDEMGSVTVMVVPKDEQDLPELLAAVAKKNTEQVAARIEAAVDQRFDGLDRNHDGKLQKKELPALLQGYFADLDRDQDGALSRDEAKQLTELLGRFGGGGLPGGGLPGGGKPGGGQPGGGQPGGKGGGGTGGGKGGGDQNPPKRGS